MGDLVVRSDGWENLVAGLGGAKDKRVQHTVKDVLIFPRQELEQLYYGDGLAAKIVDTKAEDATREWIELEDEYDDEDVESDLSMLILEPMQQAGTPTAFKNALGWSRLYGGAFIYIQALDGNTPDKPLNLKTLRAVEKLRVMVREDLEVTNSTFQTDPARPGYGDMLLARVRMTAPDGTQTTTDIHPSRLIFFPSQRRFPDSAATGLSNDDRFWGMSELQHVYDQIRDTNGAFDNVASALFELSVGVFKLSGLAAIMAQEGGEKMVQKRIETMNILKSMIHSIIISDGDEYSRENIPLSGIGDVLDRMMMVLASVSDYPVTKLFGRSAAGMNATGEGDLKNYYDSIKSLQVNYLMPKIHQIVGVYAALAGVDMSKVKIKFNSLYQIDPKQEAEVEKLEAEAKKIKAEEMAAWIGAGVLSAEEVYEQEWESTLGPKQTTIPVPTPTIPQGVK